MIPRYRASLDLTARTEAVTASGVLAAAREWISAVERSHVPELVPGRCSLASGAEVALLQHVHHGKQLFALRYDRPVNGAAWRTELGFEPTAEGGKAFIAVSSGVGDRGAGRGRGHPPTITRMLLSRYAASAGMPLLDAPIPVAEPEDVDELVAALAHRSRRVAVVCVTVEEDTRKPLLNEAVQLQNRLTGLAQVMVLAEPAATRLTQRLTDETGSAELARQWGVFGGTVRLYWPGIDFRTGTPFRHRLWTRRAGELDHAELEDELFDSLAWASAQRDEARWIHSSFIQRLIERDATAEARSKAQEDEKFYEAYCRRLEAETGRLERERDALVEQKREALDRADEAEKGRESLRYQYTSLVAQAEELRRRPVAAAGASDSQNYTVLRYCKGGQRERDCVDELDLADDTRAHVEEHLAWLAAPGSWAKPAGRLEHLRDGVHEFRVNVKDHWLRLLVARVPKLRAVLVLHAFAKKTNDVPFAEIKVAVERLRELSAG
jgi:phage-related protein